MTSCRRQALKKPDTAQASTQEIRRHAMALLARREHAGAELKAKLCARGYNETQVSTVISQLAHERLQSDQRFAEAFVHARIEKAQGPLKIKAGLSARGVETGLADAALQSYAEQWVMLARQCLLKRFKRVASDYAERARQMRFLQMRGFSVEQIRAATNESYINDRQ